MAEKAPAAKKVQVSAPTEEEDLFEDFPLPKGWEMYRNAKDQCVGYAHSL